METKQKSSWLCRVIGHRWTALKPYRIDDMLAVETQIFGCCTRCGEPTPEELTGYEYDPD
jgi:RNA polymerase-binding transcription factor DksA